MRKNKNNYAVWSTRIKKQTSNTFRKVGSSINVDKRLYREDIKGSIVHTEMLYKQKIISIKTKEKILWGLNRIKNEIENTLIRDFLIIEKIYQNNLFRENLLPDSGNIKIKRNGCINRNLNLWKVSTATFTN